MSTLAQLQTAAPSAEILDEGLEFAIDDQGVDTTLKFVVDGADLPAFRDVVAGVPATTITIGGYSTTRLIPLKHPYEPNCYACSLRITPAPGAVMDDGGGTGFGFALYFATVRFRTPRFPFEAGAYPTVTRSRRNGQEMVTRKGAAYVFPSDNKRLNHDVGVPVQVAQYALTFHRLPALDDDLFDALAGCVNLTAFLGRPAGTILYHGCTSTGEQTLGGVPSYEATHEFSYRAIPHNMVMRDDGQGFEAPVQVALLSGGAIENASITNPRYMLPVAELNDLYGP